MIGVTERELALSAHDRRKAFHHSIAVMAAKAEAKKLLESDAVKAAQKLLSSPDLVDSATWFAPATFDAADAPDFNPENPLCPHCGCRPYVDAEDPTAPFSMRTIKKTVAEEFGFLMRDLNSTRRQMDLVFVRQLAMWICKEMMPHKSFPAIGREFGHRDHTTVLHACRSVQKKFAGDVAMTERVRLLRERLEVVKSDTERRGLTTLAEK